jgi:hypothetical protein
VCVSGSGFKKGDVVAVEAESLQHTPSPSPSLSPPSPSPLTTTLPSAPPSIEPPSALRGLVSYPGNLTILDPGSSYREGALVVSMHVLARRRLRSSPAAGLIVKLISSDPTTPVHPPVQAIVTEVDAQGRVQALELAVLRAFDSASSPIELVAETGPLPVRRTSNTKARPKVERGLGFGIFGPKKPDGYPEAWSSQSESNTPAAAAAAAFPSSPTSSAPAWSGQPCTGTLRVKLDSFTPYAALFKACDPRKL